MSAEIPNNCEKKSIEINNKCKICNEISTAKCSNCGQAFYCGAEHQRQDWKNHKKNCHPFLVCKNEKFGRYLIANRNIKAGEVILKESPLIRGPAQTTPPVCLGCLQVLPKDLPIECNRCGWPMCSSKCERNPNHRNECNLTYARGKVSLKHYYTPHPSYQCLTTLRCLLLKENNDSIWQKLNQLESHCDQRCGTDQWRNDREGIAKFIHRFFKCDKWNEDEILRVAGIVQINGHEVPLTEPPHVAIYNYASFVQHSCVPNLTKTFSTKGELLFWAPNPIGKGDQLSISYSDILWGTTNRNHHLKQTKMFICDCKRCQDVTELGTYYSAIKCNSSKDSVCDGSALPTGADKWEADWQCRKCNEYVNINYVTNILERAGQDLTAMERNSLDHCSKYIEHYSKWLPSHHYYMCDVKMTLVQLIGAGGPNVIQNISDEQLNVKIQVTQELLKIFEIIAPVEARCLGTLRFELHAGLAELGRRSAQQLNENFKSALEESVRNAEEVVRLLQHEPSVLTEGQICAQAKININSLKVMLGMTVGLEL